jgi:hypothetical protein
MKSKIIMHTSITLALISTIILSSFTSKNKLSIDGAWSFVEVKTVKPDGTTTSVFPKKVWLFFQTIIIAFVGQAIMLSCEVGKWQIV